MIISLGSEPSNIQISAIHRLDTRVKLFLSVTLFLAVILTRSSHWHKFLAYFLVILVLIFVSHASTKAFARKLLFLAPLIAFLAASVFLFSNRSATANIMILWNLTVKSILCYLTMALLASTTEFYHLIQSLEHIRVPRVVTGVLTFAYRYVFILTKEAERQRRAREARTFGKQSKRERVRVTAGLLPQMFFRALERSERIYAAMLARGFDGKIRTISFFRFRAQDVAFLICFLIILGVCFFVL